MLSIFWRCRQRSFCFTQTSRFLPSHRALALNFLWLQSRKLRRKHASVPSDRRVNITWHFPESEFKKSYTSAENCLVYQHLPATTEAGFTAGLITWKKTAAEQEAICISKVLHVNPLKIKHHTKHLRRTSSSLSFQLWTCCIISQHYSKIRLKSGKDEFQFKKCYRFILLFKKIFVHFEYTKWSQKTQISHKKNVCYIRPINCL